MSEESFKQVFSKFFPSFSSSTGSYAHHVFSCMDNTGSGSVNFEQFLSTLALLTHGSYDERVAWIFRLYDVNKDGSICRGDLEEITASVSNTSEIILKDKNLFSDLLYHRRQGGCGGEGPDQGESGDYVSEDWSPKSRWENITGNMETRLQTRHSTTSISDGLELKS